MCVFSISRKKNAKQPFLCWTDDGTHGRQLQCEFCPVTKWPFVAYCNCNSVQEENAATFFTCSEIPTTSSGKRIESSSCLQMGLAPPWARAQTEREDWPPRRILREAQEAEKPQSVAFLPEKQGSWEAKEQQSRGKKSRRHTSESRERLGSRSRGRKTYSSCKFNEGSYFFVIEINVAFVAEDSPSSHPHSPILIVLP